MRARKWNAPRGFIKTNRSTADLSFLATLIIHPVVRWLSLSTKFQEVLFTLVNFYHSQVFNKTYFLTYFFYNFIFPYGWQEYCERILTYLVSTFVRLCKKRKWIVKWHLLPNILLFNNFEMRRAKIRWIIVSQQTVTLRTA